MINEPTVVLLAGGKSTRFWPLSDKNLLSFLGKPLIVHQLEKLKQAGFEKIKIVVNQENKDEIQKLHSNCIVQKEHGIGAAVLSAVENINGSVLVINADDVFGLDLLIKVKDFIEKNNPANFLTAVEVKDYFPGGYLVMDAEKVKGIIEKPGPDKMPSHYFRFVLDYYQDAKTIREPLTRIRNPDDYEQAINEAIKNGAQFGLVTYEGEWTSLKYPWHVLNTANLMLEGIKESKISEKAQIDKSAILKGPIIIEDGVKVFENAKIVGPTYIGKDTIVGNNTIIRESIIEEKCIIGFTTDIARSYLGPNCWFHSNYIGDSVLEGNTSLGAGANLANLRLDEGVISSTIKEEKIATQKTKFGSIIGQNVRIGVNTSIMPGVKVGKGTFISAGILIDKDILDDQFCYGKTNLVMKKNLKAIAKDREEFRKKL